MDGELWSVLQLAGLVVGLAAAFLVCMVVGALLGWYEP